MTISDEQALARAEQDAALWLVVLAEAEDDGGARQAEFEAWLEADPLHVEIWRRTRLAYDYIGMGQPAHAGTWQGAARQHSAAGRSMPAPRRRAAMDGRGAKRLSGAKRPSGAKRLAAIALAAAAAILVALLLPPTLLPAFLRSPAFPSAGADHATATGESRSLALPDGSLVHLAPDSAIAVAVSGTARRIELITGQIFLEVARDPARPFQVAAGHARVTVLGTAFDVQRSDGTVRVAVRHGAVRVADPTTRTPTLADLGAGDWIDLTDAGARRGNGPPDDVGSWLQGRLVARDRPAAEVLDTLRRYHDGVILVPDAAFAERRVSGLYDLRDPVRTLTDLAASHDAVVRRLTPWILVVTAD